MAWSWETRDLDFDNFVFMLRDVVGDDDLSRQFFVARCDKEDIAGKTKLADHSVPRPLRHVDDSAFGASAWLAQRDLHLDLVSVHGGGGKNGRNEDIAVDAVDFLSRNHEPISIAV